MSPSRSGSDPEGADLAAAGFRHARKGGLARGLLAATVGCALIYASWVAFREYEAEQIDAIARRLLVNPTPAGEKMLDAAILACGADCPARGLEAASAGKAALAGRAQGGPRDQLYAEAAALTRQALRRNPLSAESWARLSMILSDRAGGGLTEEALRALRTSFSAAPFSRPTAAWRIGFCGRHWAMLDADLRRGAADELGWLATIDRPLATALVAQTTDPSAQFVFQLRLGAEPDR